MKKFLLKTTALALLGMCLANPAGAMFGRDDEEPRGGVHEGLVDEEVYQSACEGWVRGRALMFMGSPPGKRYDDAGDVFRRILRNYSHPNLYNAACRLSSSGDEENNEIAFGAFRSIAQDSEHARQYDAARLLWINGKRSNNEEDKQLAFVAFRSVAENLTHPDTLGALHTIWNQDSKDWVRNHIKTVLAQRQGPYSLLESYKDLLLESRDLFLEGPDWDDRIVAISFEENPEKFLEFIEGIKNDRDLLPAQKADYLKTIEETRRANSWNHRAPMINAREAKIAADEAAEVAAAEAAAQAALDAADSDDESGDDDAASKSPPKLV